jgi:hypothetical protein
MKWGRDDRSGKMASVEYVQKISEEVFRELLAASAGGSEPWRSGEADRMIVKDGDGGVKFARRAQCYSHVIRATLKAIDKLGADA